jgi:GDP-L-fucose synthase
MINLKSKILITGAKGLVGSALILELKKQGYENLVPLARTDCDLTQFASVKSLFQEVKPDIVFHLAASVYGIAGNVKNRGSLFLENILMNTHVIESSRLSGVKKIIAMGTIAAYPPPVSIPVKEDHIWNGPPHASENSYGHAKRAMLAQLLAYHENYNLDFAYVISTNLYGPNDKFDSQFGHVIPSLIRKFYEAKKHSKNIEIWGDGTAARDFLYAKDMARALVFIMNKLSLSINVSSGKKTTIKEVVQLLSNYFEIDKEIVWNTAMPNGRSHYEIDLSLIKSAGFEPAYTFAAGLTETLDWFCTEYEKNLVRC